jgi:hypothetical protein
MTITRSEFIKSLVVASRGGDFILPTANEVSHLGLRYERLVGSLQTAHSYYGVPRDAAPYVQSKIAPQDIDAVFGAPIRVILDDFSDLSAYTNDTEETIRKIAIAYDQANSFGYAFEQDDPEREDIIVAMLVLRIIAKLPFSSSPQRLPDVWTTVMNRYSGIIHHVAYGRPKETAS